MYKTRMFNYYTQVIQAISEFKAIIDGEYPEFEDISNGKDTVLTNSYLMTMGEDRIKQWERVFGIKPLESSTIDDRRDVIIARIRGQGKFNSALINSIVNTFTGGTAESWVKDSVLYVSITPPPTNKQFVFSNVEQEIAKKLPAHLGLQISRNYYRWSDIKSNYSTWQDVSDTFDTWNDVFLFVPFK